MTHREIEIEREEGRREMKIKIGKIFLREPKPLRKQTKVKQSNQMINTQELSVAKSELQRKVQAKLTTQ